MRLSIKTCTGSAAHKYQVNEHRRVWVKDRGGLWSSLLWVRWWRSWRPNAAKPQPGESVNLAGFYRCRPQPKLRNFDHHHFFPFLLPNTQPDLQSALTRSHKVHKAALLASQPDFHPSSACLDRAKRELSQIPIEPLHRDSAAQLWLVRRNGGVSSQ